VSVHRRRRSAAAERSSRAGRGPGGSRRRDAGALGLDGWVGRAVPARSERTRAQAWVERARTARPRASGGRALHREDAEEEEREHSQGGRRVSSRAFFAFAAPQFFEYAASFVVCTANLAERTRAAAGPEGGPRATRRSVPRCPARSARRARARTREARSGRGEAVSDGLDAEWCGIWAGRRRAAALVLPVVVRNEDVCADALRRR